MGYKWKPSKTARKLFAEKMNNDSQFAADYYQRKQAKAEKRRSGSNFNYESAGGYYVPTRDQYIFCLENMHLAKTTHDQTAFNCVISGYSCNEKVHHDMIHIVNEFRRKPNLPNG